MIQVHDLWKKFGRHEALQGLSFSVPEASAYALIGANGAGKTTTIKVLMNILEPTRGSTTVMGMDSRKISPRELSRIGYGCGYFRTMANSSETSVLGRSGPFGSGAKGQDMRISPVFPQSRSADCASLA